MLLEPLTKSPITLVLKLVKSMPDVGFNATFFMEAEYRDRLAPNSTLSVEPGKGLLVTWG